MLAITAVIALLTFVVLSFYARKGRSGEVVDTNAELYKEAVARIESQKAAGEIDDAQADQLLNDAKLQLITTDQAKAVQLNQNNPWLRWVPLIGVPVLAVLIYDLKGSADQLDIRDQMASITAQSSPAELDALAASINSMLDSNPDKHGYRVVLARVYQSQGRVRDAADQYRMLRDAYPEDVSVQLDYTQLLFSASDGQMTPELIAAYERVLELEPDNLSALTMLGMAAMHNSEPGKAVEYWQQAVQMMPDGQERQLIASGLERARQLAGEASQEGSAVAIEVALSGAEAFGDRYLFVYAVLDQGMPAPLAIKRFTPGQPVPSKIVLTDQDHMMPTHKLAAGQAVRVIARLSKTPNVMDQTNDIVVEVPTTTQQGQVDVQLLIENQ